MIVNEIIKKIEERFPASLQEEYDNTGAQVIFPDETVKSIYICLDADMKTIPDAVEKGCNLIISHHPMLFKPLKKINANETRSMSIIELINRKISLFTLHTNFDKMMFSYLSEIAGFPGGKLLIRTGIFNEEDVGFGSFAELKESMSFNNVIEKIKQTLNLDFILFCGNKETEISTIAFINGSGGGSIERVISSSKPDCIVTGDVGYHHAKYAIDNNVCIIDAGHFGTEIIFKKLLAESLKDIISVNNKIPDIVISAVEQNPFKVS